LKRTLSLKREHLADLTRDELGVVAAGAIQPPDPNPTIVSCPIRYCLMDSNLNPCYSWAC
jgi:hypothetical protein